MKIKLDWAPGTEVKLITNELGEQIGVELTPFFTTSRGLSVFGTGTVESATGKTLSQMLLSVSGATGKMQQMVKREVKAVVPFVDMPATTKPAAKKAQPNSSGA